jgi:hypothetical protein
MIKVVYTSIDYFRKARSFKTVAGAKKFAHKYVGAHPEIGVGYAVSSDGIGKVTVQGATLAEIFPEDTTAAKPTIRVSIRHGDYEVWFNGFKDAFKTREAAEAYAASLVEPPPPPEPTDEEMQAWYEEQMREERARELAACAAENAMMAAWLSPKRRPGCTCTDAYIANIGCDCPDANPQLELPF